MATCGNQSSEQEKDVKDTFYDIDACSTTPLSILLKINQPSTAQTPKRPLPVGVITDRSLIDLILKATGFKPMGVTLMNDTDAVVEFEKGVKITEIAQLLHSIDSWVGYKVEVGCIIATKKQLVKTTMDIEEQRRATRELEQKKQEFEEEQQASRIQIKDLLDKFEEQVKRIEMVHSRSTVGPTPIDVVTPQVSDVGLASPVLQHPSYKLPPLPKFSGALPVPKGEGSFEQFMFQIRGFKGSYTEEAMKNGIVGAVTDGARDYLDFIGFENDLTTIIDALDMRYGKGQSTDRIQQEFYQLSQERGETIQQFAGRMELKYKKLVELYPGRYTKDILKERLFYGMTQHLRNSMRYLYKKPGTTYEELMMSAKEAEAEWIDNKARVKSAIIHEDPGKKEREELKQRIEKLTESVKTANLQTKPASPRHKKSPRSPRVGRQNVNERGPEPTAAGPFHGNRRPLQCYKCGGWGHVARECPTAENLDWRGLMRADPTPEKAPGPESTVPNQQ